MATASRGRYDTWDMGIGASGRSLLSIEVPNGRQLPFWVSLGSRRRMRGHAYFTLRERGSMGGCQSLRVKDPIIVAHMYPPGARMGETMVILTGARAGEKRGE